MKRKIIGLTTSAIIGSSMFSTVASAESIKVQPGDTLWSISKKYSSTVAAIKEANNLSSELIFVGQELHIPNKELSASKTDEKKVEKKTNEKSTYTVQKGDSLWLIAKKYSISVQELKELNGLTNDLIYPGQLLHVTKQSQESLSKQEQKSQGELSPKSSDEKVEQTYVVKAGDSLWKIAKAYQMSIESLKTINQLTSDTIYIGQVLKLEKSVEDSSTKQQLESDVSSTITNGKVLVMIHEAKKLVGTPYKWGGNTPSGFDCSGFIYYMMNKVTSISRLSTESYWNVMQEIEEPAIGDFVFFETYKKGPSHMGIYLGNHEFIHASSNGVMISNLTSPYWSERYLGAKRYFH